VKRTPLARKTPMARAGAVKHRPLRRGAMDPDFRAQVMNRDRYVCQAWLVGFRIGGSCAGHLHAHHRMLVTKVDELWNVVTVCASCHNSIHTHPSYARCYGLVIPRSWAATVDDPGPIIDELVRRLAGFRLGFDPPPRGPWVTNRDLAVAATRDRRWSDAVEL
jgi:hypothetical protein